MVILSLPMSLEAQVVVEKSQEVVTISGKQYYMHHVKKGETLYSIARVYQVTEAEIRKLNPEIDELGLQADMVIGIPVIQVKPVVPETPAVTQEVTPQGGDEPGDDYMVYTVKESEKTKRFLRRMDITEEEFRRLNPSVGSRLFVGQKVLIPVVQIPLPDPYRPAPDTDKIWPDTLVVDTLVVEEQPSGPFVLPAERPEQCNASPENARRQYRVALLIPLYLDEVDRLDTSKEKAEKTKNMRAMKFLQFYEGFMMAVDSLTENEGLRLDLTVIDVDENTATAHAAVSQLRKTPVDLIVGPFFSKSFTVVQQYAKEEDILLVNPMSERENIVVDAPNVVKLKPNPKSMAEELSALIQRRYPKAKVTLIAQGGFADTAMINAIEKSLMAAVPGEVQLSNEEMLELIAKESRRRKMGKRMLSTLEVEGQIFSTRALQEFSEGTIVFENEFKRLSFGQVDVFKQGLSSARENVLVAYGEDVVFATQILNTINKSAQNYPITLIGLPDWSEFDNLLVPTLLSMKAIYFDDYFVDYNDSLVLKFVDDFRLKYESEPEEYAFEGFDVAWYFLRALMEFGPKPLECLPYYHEPLLHTRYYFNKKRYEDGLENRCWSVFQYDSATVELKPIWIDETEGEDTE